MNISPARIAAFEILWKIEADKAFSSVLLPLAEEKLDGKDKGLCHELTLGVLRRQMFLDAVIDKFANGKKIDAAIRIILRIGLYQLTYLDKIPAHAIINDAVNLVGKIKKTSAKGFVNAILRKAAREKVELVFADEIEKLAVETSHPRWLIERWTRQFGADETAKLCAANNETPKLDFRPTAKTTEAVKVSLQKDNIAAEKDYLRELADNGKIYFQDSASQMTARTVDLQPHESYLDVCCAPGSKFSMVNYLRGESHKLFVGGDLHLPRLKIVRQICEKTAVVNYQILAYDAERDLPFADESFDVVLLDAPCSGTGTIRRNPEIRYFLRETDFAELAAKQLNILQNASKVLKTGGRLIYSTCSLEIEENERVCESFLTANPHFSVVKSNLPEKFQTADNYSRTFPQRDKCDGFFIAVFNKL